MSSRRQSRLKQPTSYRVEDSYSFLDDEEGSAPLRTPVAPEDEDEDEDEDNFMPDADAEEEPDEDDFEDDAVEESENEAPVDEEALARESSVIDVDALVVTPSRTAKGKGKSMRRVNALPQVPAPSATGPVQVPHSFARSGGRKVNMDDDKMRSRGIADFSKQGGQEMRLKDLFGPTLGALKPILRTRDQWRQQDTLPRRALGGLRRSYFESEDARSQEAKLMKTWYAESGRESFAKGQHTSHLSAEEGTRYMLNHGTDSLNVLMGTTDNPQVYPMKKGSFMNIAEPFNNKADRIGWLFNMGSRVQDAQWATNEDGSPQYLAVTVEQKDTCPRPNTMENPTAPAFTATTQFAASIQIWAFEATTDHVLDCSKQPRLTLVICTDWGAPKHIRWSPIKAEDQDASPGDNDTIHIGLLAGIWSDGCVRVLDIRLPRTELSIPEPIYMHVSQAAFDAVIPQTIPTCLQWLSGSTIAVGTSAGTLAIWTLTKSKTLSPAQEGGNSSSPRPWFYKQIADTYILTLLSGWPSQPHFLSATTADGFARLYDIRSPEADTVTSVRGRVLVVTQAWHEHTQSFIMPDEHYILKHNPIRRYYHNIYTARADSSIVRVAASPVHPGVLIGGANGSVFASNPVGRVVNTKVVPWQQNWFVHEWRPPVDKMVVKPPTADHDNTEEPTPSKSTPAILSQPMVRISEGYRATQPGIQFSATAKKKPENENSTLITIFEEGSCISALAWNANLKFGTWAVAGFNSGLLRVEDVGV